MEWYLGAFKKYAVFSGRARRKEFWMFILFNILFSIAAVIIDNVLGLANDRTGYGLFSGLYSLAIILPSLGMEIRRLHDVGKSGWWIFISLIPLVGAIWLIVLLATEGQPGDNQYGPDPKAVS